MSTASTILLPFQPSSMSTAQLAAVSFLARYSGRTHRLYTYQLKRWFAWCEGNGLDPLTGIQRAHVELYIRHLGDTGLMDSSIVTMMHGVRGYFRFAHIDGLITADPAVYARLPKVQCDESRFQVLKEPGKTATSQSYVWVQRGSPDDHPLVLYEYDPSRSAEAPKRLFEVHGQALTALFSRAGCRREWPPAW